jgi:3-hydroxyisobutyrate dehydrogenase-like beta-hydroxyacid dehydrogenase
MTASDVTNRSVGWLGTGRMGAAMAARLVRAGHPVTVWNRTRSKTDELRDAGAGVASSIAELAECEVVFVMVATPSDLEDVLTGPQGLLGARHRTRVIVSCATVDAATSARLRRFARDAGVEFLAAPISGNPHVVADGGSTFMVSGPRSTYDDLAPLLEDIARRSIWVGEAEEALVVKLAHNLYLGLLVQSLVEVTTLAEKSGVARSVFLDFLNSTGLATDWVRRRTPDLLALDWTPTFTTELLRKDFDLGMATARDADVPMLLAASVHQLLGAAIGRGYGELDFLSLFEVQAASAGLDVEPT